MCRYHAYPCIPVTCSPTCPLCAPLPAAEFARVKGLSKAEVDCLGGLGVLHRAQVQHREGGDPAPLLPTLELSSCARAAPHLTPSLPPSPQNDPSRAMMYLGKALELAEKLGDLDLKASTLCNMGSVLMQVQYSVHQCAV